MHTLFLSTIEVDPAPRNICGNISPGTLRPSTCVRATDLEPNGMSRSSLPTPCGGAGVLTECARNDWRLDVHVDLLTDEKRGTLSRNSIDHLKNAGIYAFGAIARERFLGDDIGLK